MGEADGEAGAASTEGRLDLGRRLEGEGPGTNSGVCARGPRKVVEAASETDLRTGHAQETTMSPLAAGTLSLWCGPRGAAVPGRPAGRWGLQGRT